MSVSKPSALDVLPLNELCEQANPDRLFVIASLLSANPPALPGARVLELGAKNGTNILSLAAMYPDTLFIVEPTETTSADTLGAWRQALDLANLEIRTGVGPSQSEAELFDYILCPNAFHTGTQAQRSAWLTDIKRRLAPQGVALVAYPVLPGAYFERMTGEMMAYHANQFADSASRVSQARAMLDFLAESAEPEAYRTLLGRDAERLHASDAALQQTLDGHAQDAFYVNEFFGLAGSAGLQFVGEAPLSTMLPENFGDSIAEILRRIGADVFRSEQYIDFLSARSQRFSLLMHANVPLDRNITEERLGAWRVAADLREKDDGRFLGPGGGDFTTRSETTRRILSELAGRWPESEALSDVLDRHGLTPDADQTSSTRADLLHCYMLGALQLRSQALPVARDPGTCPMAWPPARLQAMGQIQGNGDRQPLTPDSEARVPAALHAALDVDEFTRYLLTRLDGSRDRSALLRDLEAAVDNQTLSLQDNGQPVTEQARRRELLDDILDQALDQIGRAGLLVEMPDT